LKTDLRLKSFRRQNDNPKKNIFTESAGQAYGSRKKCRPDKKVGAAIKFRAKSAETVYERCEGQSVNAEISGKL